MAEERGTSELRGRRGGWNVERILLVLTLICSSTAFVFGIGVQWARTIAVEANVNALRAAVMTDYVRADVYAADQRALTAAIDRLTHALEAIDARERGAPP